MKEIEDFDNNNDLYNHVKVAHFFVVKAFLQ